MGEAKVAEQMERFSDDITVEVAGNFATREDFMGAVEALTSAGFAHDDISVLDTHESLSAAGKPSEAWQELLETNGWTEFVQTGEEFQAFLADEDDRITAVLQEIGLIE